MMRSRDRFRQAKGGLVTAKIQTNRNGYMRISISPDIAKKENLRIGSKIKYEIKEISD